APAGEPELSMHIEERRSVGVYPQAKRFSRCRTFLVNEDREQREDSSRGECRSRNPFGSLSFPAALRGLGYAAPRCKIRTTSTERNAGTCSGTRRPRSALAARAPRAPASPRCRARDQREPRGRNIDLESPRRRVTPHILLPLPMLLYVGL